MNTETRKY